MAKIIDSLKKLNVENNRRVKKNDRVEKQSRKLILSIEEKVSPNENYILAVCGTQSEPEFKIGAALSDHSCVIYSAGESLRRIITLDHNRAPVVGIKFSPISKNILYTANNNGEITACDLRAKGKVVAEFKDSTEDGKIKPLASFDISCDERLIAGGTEHISGDAFILFWDLRFSNSNINSKNNLLGGYWESHIDDVTCLSFHSNKRDILASGSTDGLINVFDLIQPSEDLALTHSLNTESSVDRIGWLSDDSLWCTTHTHGLQLWDCNGATAYAKLERKNFAISQNDNPDTCYLVKFHATDVFGSPFVLMGSSTAKGENLRCLNITNDCIETCNDIIGNKQIVRDSWIHEKSGCLVTAGEGGIINIWRQMESMSIQQKSSGDRLLGKIVTAKNRNCHHKTKPY